MLMMRIVRHVLCYAILFFLHRLLILPDIGAQTLVSDGTRVLLLGFLSDLSVSLGIVFLFVIFNFPQLLSQLFIIFLSMLLMGHVSYAQFYHVTVRASHLSYLLDLSFMRSSIVSAFLTRGMIHIPIGFVISLFVPGRPASQKIVSRVSASLVLLVCCILSNSLSQTWGRRADLSEHLRNNVVVGLVVDAQRLYRRQSSQSLTDDDWKILKSLDPALPHFERVQDLSDADLEKFVTFLSFDRSQTLPEIKSSGLPYLRNSLRVQLSSNTLLTQPRYVIAVLMESTRSLDSKLYNPTIKGSTAELDALLSDGIRFENGYSNGTVTRAGSESTLCNSLASQDVNAMRNAPLSKPVCIAELAGKLLDDHHISYLFTYLHGGYLSFDRQNEFWTQNKFDIPIDILTLPSDLPRTDWGLSDKTFLNLTVDWFKEQQAQSQSGLNFVFVQTMTNHFAWSLPSDADDDLKVDYKNTALRNLVTLRYQSRELGKWVEQLKKLDVWKNAIVVFIGDHGYIDGSEQHPEFYVKNDAPELHMQADALTKVYYGLSGGLVESALKDCRKARQCAPEPMVSTQLATQADFLPTVIDLLGKSEIPLIGKSYFDTGHRLPQLIDVEDNIYIPELNNRVISKRDFFNSEQTEKDIAVLSARQKLYLQLTLNGTLSGYLRRVYLKTED